ncbi:MAG: pilus assembly protein [Terracoccus sp.]
MSSPARRSCESPEDGRAVVEFIFLGVLLLLPLVYLVLTAARLQSAAFSASLAGREAGRAFVTGANDADAGARARSAAALAFEDFAFTRGTSLGLSCDGSPCLRPDGTVTATASIVVQLPLVPDFISDRVPSAVTISATHLATVDRYVGR